MGIIAYVKMLVKGRDVVKEAINQGQVLKNVHAKSTFRSSEFLLSSLAALGAIGASLAGILPASSAAIALAASSALYSIARGLAKNGDPLGGVKPGLATTEALGTVLAGVATVVGALQGVVSPDTAAILIAVSNGAFAASRGLAKGGEQPQE